MLPNILNTGFVTKAKTHLIAGVTAVAILAAGAMPAEAWGKKEQQFLAGAVTAGLIGALILQSNNRAHAKPQPQPQYQPRHEPRYQPRVIPEPQYYTPTPRQPTYYQPAQVSIYGSPIGRAFNSYTANERRRIQSTLTAYGYYNGSIDGAFGPGTYNALDYYARNTSKSAMLDSNTGAYGLLDGLLF